MEGGGAGGSDGGGSEGGEGGGDGCSTVMSARQPQSVQSEPYAHLYGPFVLSVAPNRVFGWPSSQIPFAMQSSH